MSLLHAAVRVEARFARPSDRHCCVFARSVFVDLYGAAAVNRVPALRWHLDVQTGRDRGVHVGPGEPVVAAVEAGLADFVSQPLEGRWHVVQGWRGQPLASSGHTFLWRAVAQGRGLLLDSVEARGMRLTGITPWDDEVARYRGGLWVAALRVPMGASLG